MNPTGISSDTAQPSSLELRVKPFDRRGNALTTPQGYAVSIDSAPLIPLLPPDFSFAHTIPADYEGEIELSFTLNHVAVKDSPITIKVIKSDTTLVTKENVYIGVFGLMFAVFVVLTAEMLLSKSANDVDIMTMGAGMAGIMKSMATNTLDPITEFVSRYLVMSGCSGWVLVLGFRHRRVRHDRPVIVHERQAAAVLKRLQGGAGLRVLEQEVPGE